MKYFFSDVDGTLLQDHKLDANTVSLVEDFINKGNKFILATGRIDSDIQRIEEKLGFAGDYRISQNGAVINDKNNNIIYKKLLPKEILPELTEYIFSLENVTIEVTEVKNRYATAERKISHVYEFTLPVNVVPNIKEKIANLECTLFLILSDDTKLFERISREIKEKWGDKVYAVLTSPGCLEVISTEVSKGNAIAYLQEMLKIKDEDIFVAGDSYNDVSMFEKYPNSFAMEQAPDDVKSPAKNVASNVGEVVKLINKIS
ncbi:MAG: HAD family hydrolase [Alphaproteobacteria bacterium]|jgi:Cof subfamily protein (haloacid dehalogenase superfamily)|nr:HAD family hydrolase [Alphaproteobacteria bacterium]